MEGLDSDEDRVLFIKEIFDVFTKQFFVVEISAINRTEAFQIFQTINARGLDLSAADLIKSDFFGNSGEHTQEVTEIWNRIQESLGDLNFSDFIRYSWNSKYSFITARGLYKTVSKSINGPDKILEFMKMLERLSVPYAELNGDIEPTYFVEAMDGRQAIYILQELQELKFKTYQPLYLASINVGLTGRQVLALVSASANILIRNKILNQGTNWLEKLFSTLAQELNDNQLEVADRVASIIQRLAEEQPNDQIITAKLTDFDFSLDTRLARYILRRIENERSSEKGLINFDNKKVHLEHIMPQNPQNFLDWSVDENMHERYLWKLGNLTLLLGSKNSSISNNPFDQKKLGYETSDVGITRALARESTWNPKMIDQRTGELIRDLLAL